MVRIAGERISDLFAQAEREAFGRTPALADRYVALARRIGMRYNVRLLEEYAEVYCRGCSRFWVEGRTVRTRLRAGRRVRTCLACGRERRVPFRRGRGAGGRGTFGSARAAPQPEVGLIDIAERPGPEEPRPPEPEAR